ncbi:NYN domain-containing protein [Actinoallomurus rhizosphaericola]|uniref:NYN domain-containing protein n=1 Tax=Actinoallomurus rhizosphaericola TaxID=2952536 RepID=UPI002092D0BB|nr:NYN domain-containing protein [Actinoallomurus rhizosphaericola]MCO5997446.1 NYN domain-containing protein [Actinoallomurus rhizosphaericola]
MDRCALFVDAGYLLADGAMAVHGTRRRESVSWDFAGLLQLLGNLARERTGLPLLRCYWYEATVEGRRTPEHDALADLPGIKLRLSRIRPGRREGVDTEIHRDLMTLARNGGVADAVIVSGDEDLAQVIADAQDLGVRVTVVHVAVDGNWTISRVLRQECDDLIEIASGHLRPYVNLLAGVDTSSSPLANGTSSNGSGGALAPLRPSPQHGAAPPSTPITPSPSLGSATSSTSSSLGRHSSSGQPSMPTPPLHSAPTHSAPTPSTPSVPTAGSPGTGNNSGPQYPQQPVGPYTGPQQITPTPVQQSTPTLADAVKAAHKEGQEFGESVARDAPALWLEAVLARKPRMPSDLEARLLQGSSLPIDFLLHDEVRHALRRGFWDALERSRRS